VSIFEQIESNVRSYCRSFPALFTRAKGHRVWDDQGEAYIDFFTGASSLNYGHNHPRLKRKLLDYIADDGMAHSLDMSTVAKGHFLQRFHDVILRPRRLNYKVMFPGPTGTNAVEAALKLARKVTGRQTVISFTNAFHGMTLGALAVTGNAFKRQGAGVPLNHAARMPFDGYLAEPADSLDYLERFLSDNGSGVELPAAIVLETVQGEGGINVASFEWLQAIEQICRRWGILLIVDDIQTGCGRTGPFFSFEPAGIQPDIVTLSKSISGYGLPMALTLFKSELDIWEPGEHNGTFRGHNLAFVTAAESLSFWETDQLSLQTDRYSTDIRSCLDQLVADFPELQGEVRGRGLMLGVACGPDGVAGQICRAAFERGLLIETSGPNDEVVKLLPPLVIDRAGLEQGLQILAESAAHVVREGSGSLLKEELV
jgi:diaminobutyrate-2-oxoglutarate transaminase